MGDVGMIPSLAHNRQESLLAAHNLLKELEANESLTDDMKKILADIDSKLSAMNLNPEPGPAQSQAQTRTRETEFNEARDKLKSAEEKIMSWERESCQLMIWEAGQEKAIEYIQAVDEVRNLVGLFRGFGSDANELVSEAEGILQAAMARLEEELVYLLANKRQSYEEPSEDDHDHDGSSQRSDETGPHESEGVVFEVIEPEVVEFLKLVKKTMFDSSHDQEFRGAYIRTQKEALEDCLTALGMETLSIDELLKLDWTTLDSKIKTWVQVMKTAVQVYLRAEKHLCDEIFGSEDDSDLECCFVSTAKQSMTCLLTFGQAMALGPHTPEKLFNLLDMYQVLVDLRPEVNSLFSGTESYVKAEFREVLEMLGECAKATFLRFKDVIMSDPSNDPFPGGGVHPLSSYVMNYIIVYLPDYCNTLNLLLQDDDSDNNVSVTVTVTENSKCRLGCELRSITNSLKSNLEKKSVLYKDVALQHVFLMNNIHYIQQKVTGSELRGLFGDEWIRTQMVSYQQHATSYVRSTWGSVVSSLRDEGLPSGSGSGLKAVLRERIRVFSAAFEEVYRSQTGWIIRDEQLKEELRISISQRVILAYQSFIGRHNKYDIEKYVKYDSDDLEDLLRDFFEGSQKSLHYTRRR